MFSTNNGDSKIINIHNLSDRGMRAAGAEETSSILPAADEYTNTRSAVSKQFDEYLKSINTQELKREVDGMGENKLLEMYIEKVDKDQRELRENMKEREERVEKQIEASEARENERMNRIEQMISSQNEKIDSLKEKISEQLEEDKKYRHTNNIAIVTGVVATVIALIGIYYATVSMITDIIGVTIK
ncbi:hypothetical protein [Alitiscatomonas aceti]|uniref:DUF1640 domain-containing protein n=1 Tax=Alitiscatomonas aceti TaxID=2981724 RepID=A0ABT2V3S1_9FIRM|nr:hypothetical protein [Alitiscatomonas aceti]MCU6800772.1 hypothetical protein [Alitiscatomonas aceti]